MKRVKHSKFKMITVTFSIAIIFSLILSDCTADTIKDSLTNTTPNNTSATISTPTSEPIHTNSSNLEVTYDEVKYNITASYSSGQDSSYGTFTSTNSNPNSHEVTLEATPKEGNGFIGWSSDINGDKIVSYYNPYKFAVTEDMTLYPVFIKGNDTVELKDPKVKRDMESRFDKSTITYSDLQQVKEYELYDIETLEDLKYFYSLNEFWVDLTPDKYYDTSYLANLVNLEMITFYSSCTLDILPFENYKNLRRLSIGYFMKDISFLLKHKDTLTYLSLSDLEIKDYEFISEFQNLEILGIHNSTFSENDLIYIPESITELSISNCTQIKDLSNLRRFTNLKSFSANNCWINDITPLSSLKNLERLFLRNNRISDLSPLSDLSKLQYLDLTNNRVTDLSPLEPLCSKSLTTVYLSYNPITDYSILKNAPDSFDFSNTNEQIFQASEVAKDMVNKLIKPEMTDEEKYGILAVALVKKVTYGSGSRAYNALVKDTSVCNGYADAYLMLCAMAGLPCYYITGDTDSAEHAWNIVKVDDNYYHIDTTWMDGVNFVSGYYFLKSDSFFNTNKHYNFVVAPDLICNDTSKDKITTYPFSDKIEGEV